MIYSLNAQRFFLAASTTKLLTEGTTLAILGPDYRFTTNVYRTGPVDANGTLQGVRLEWIPGACVTVVAASGGYPGPHETGLAIAGLEEAAPMPGVFVFHAGTRARDGRVVTSGGRVLAVSALGPSIGEARDRAYDACSRISFEGMHYRKDIGAGVEATAGG